jgi:hypothetical protein
MDSNEEKLKSDPTVEKNFIFVQNLTGKSYIIRKFSQGNVDNLNSATINYY